MKKKKLYKRLLAILIIGYAMFTIINQQKVIKKNKKALKIISG